ncbi:MBOAT, membrane-bound o-acyltransferase family domain-containing protein [Ditylenchus destructor]|uniref:O-acyltransferase n=1 Tax=Ditylenchus destructor TaxID=166010 RepID=A0AAD4N511_9BILA|nr:MBOAT, membrane-bound o-acyltransferase family domain-containing protein [Ditylenchus destructor]
MQEYLRPVHLAQDSLLSATSGWSDYRGFVNLAMLLLYGILVTPIEWIRNFWMSSPYYTWPNLTIVMFSNVTILASYLFEKALDKYTFNNSVAVPFYSLIFTLHIVIPAIMVIEIQGNPLYSSLALIIVVIEVLKLWSYAHVNYWDRLKPNFNASATRANKEKNEDVEVKSFRYPRNLTIYDLYYFMFAPTLCYELEFPRTSTLRKSFIFNRTIELIGFSFVSVALYQQWVMPLVKNSIAPFSEINIMLCLERVLKLAIPNILIWLILFYLVFHSAFNLIAEIMQFADRKFYLDFWNAETISAFWKTWNIPVHRWAVRHVYKPIVRNGYSKTTASFVVFTISAFFHEYLVSVPLHMLRLWAFHGMLAQIPLSLLTDRYLKGGRAGNIVVWLSLILGQPMAILMYVHDWYLIHHPEHGKIPTAFVI